MKRIIAFIALLPALCFAQQDNWKDVYIRGGDAAIDVDASGSSLSVTNPVTVGTEPTIAQVPFLAAVALGLVDGYSSVNKFGYNPTADDGDDVWGGDGVYAFYPTNANAVWAQSTDVDDVEGDTGAHTVKFFGLDSNWNEASETVTLNGQTSVALTNAYIRMFRGVVLTAGSTQGNEGDITVTNGAGTVAIHIETGKGQTQHTIYTIPNNKSGLFVKGYVGMGNDDKNGVDASFEWQARANNGHTGAWATKGDIDLVNIGSSWWQYEYGVPAGILLEKTDIRIRVRTASAESRVVGGYDLLLKDD